MTIFITRLPSFISLFPSWFSQFSFQTLCLYTQVKHTSIGGETHCHCQMIECHGKLKAKVSQITQGAKSINCRCFKAKKKCSKHLTIKCYNTAGFDLLWWRTQLDSTVRGKKIVESRGGLSVCTKMSGNEKHSLWYFKCSPYVPWLVWIRINVSPMFVVQLVT